jgi:GDP-4-dehydro-6-deoxy-D-mannose reductase
VPTSLATGAAGFVGQHLLKELLRSGHSVLGGTFQGERPEPGVLTAAEARHTLWVPLDVCRDEEIRQVLIDHHPDSIFHLAAQSSVGESFGDALGTWEVNATGTFRLMHAVSELAPAARVLFVSSSEVYGIVPESEQPISETRPLVPTNPYGASKAAAEIVSRQLCLAGDIHLVIARSFSHTGPGQAVSFALPNWAEQLGRMAAGRVEPVLQVGNLDARRDLLDVRDVVRAYRLLIERGSPCEVYNVSSGVAHRLSDIVEMLVDLSGAGARIELDPERLRPVDTPLILGDAGRLRALGWAPQIELRQTLRDLLRPLRDAQ